MDDGGGSNRRGNLARPAGWVDTECVFRPRDDFPMPQPTFPVITAPVEVIDRYTCRPARACLQALQLLGVLALVVILGLLSALPSLAGEQDVFVSRGAGSPVYSDKPQPGGKALTLPPINVVEPVPTGDTSVRRRPDEPARPTPGGPAYRSFRIVSPEDNGSVLANTALFDVRVAVEPALQLGAGHAIMVSINGQPVAQRFTASEFTIPPEFWGDVLPPPNQRHQLDATIVDRNGVVLERAAPVTFILRYASGGYQRPWQGPGYGPGYAPGFAPGYGPVYRPRPVPLPESRPVAKPKPPPAQPFDQWEKKFEQEGLRFYNRQEPLNQEKPIREKPGRGEGR